MSRSDRPLTVVTGGSRGIGAATVLALVRAGHDVVFSYRSDADSSERVQAAATELGHRCLPVHADVTHESDVADLFTQASSLGLVTGLVNNAGLTGRVDDLADTPQEVIREVIEVNLLAVILCTRRAIQLMYVVAPRWSRRGYRQRLLCRGDARITARIRPLRRRQGGR